MHAWQTIRSCNVPGQASALPRRLQTPASAVHLSEGCSLSNLDLDLVTVFYECMIESLS